MQRAEDVSGRIDQVAAELRRRGLGDLARELDVVIEQLRRRGTVPKPAGGVVTTGEAAQMLGVRSITTVKRWALDGLLDGYRRGGRLMISRTSVERLLNSPKVAEEKAREVDQDAALAPLDFTGEDIPPTSWPGRRPWESTRGDD